MVSDLFHSPSRGVFHLSLTVLVHYRSAKVFSLGDWSPQIPTAFRVSRGTQELRQKVIEFRVRDSHPLWLATPRYSLILSLSYTEPYNRPDKSGLWAFPCSLTATNGISVISFPPGT